MATDAEVLETIIAPMLALYSPRRNADPSAAVQYVPHLTRYRVEALREGWVRLVRNYRMGVWPSIGEIISHCDAAQDALARAELASKGSPATHGAANAYTLSNRAQIVIREMAERAADRHARECQAIADRYGVPPSFVAFHLRDVVSRAAWGPVSGAIMASKPYLVDWEITPAQWEQIEGRVRTQSKLGPIFKTFRKVAAE